MSDLRAVVFLSHGRWVARCPRPGCYNGEHFGPDGGLSDWFHCREWLGGCGLRCAADWPPNIADIEQVTSCRPVPTTRNWFPGETLDDLIAENVVHGILPFTRAQIEAAQAGEMLPVLSIMDNRLTLREIGG